MRWRGVSRSALPKRNLPRQWGPTYPRRRRRKFRCAVPGRIRRKKNTPRRASSTRTPPEKLDLVLSGQSEGDDGEDAALLTPVITLEIVQGYSVTALREPVA